MSTAWAEEAAAGSFVQSLAAGRRIAEFLKETV